MQILTERIRASKAVIAKIIEVVDQNRNIQIMMRDIHEKQQQVAQLEAAVHTKRIEVNQVVITLAVLIYQLNEEQADDDLDRVFLGDNIRENDLGRRRDLGEITRQIRLLYTVDPLDALHPELMEVVRENTRDFDRN
jgi:hypothetical protein